MELLASSETPWSLLCSPSRHGRVFVGGDKSRFTWPCRIRVQWNFCPSAHTYHRVCAWGGLKYSFLSSSLGSQVCCSEPHIYSAFPDMKACRNQSVIVCLLSLLALHMWSFMRSQNIWNNCENVISWGITWTLCPLKQLNKWSDRIFGSIFSTWFPEGLVELCIPCRNWIDLFSFFTFAQTMTLAHFPPSLFAYFIGFLLWLNFL